ncbi:MAG: hypothetical protein IT335_03420, partial [Thermomicrobiales bacterium]|nr:hypothetical protein [Thermomicrobiales bacterium]
MKPRLILPMLAAFSLILASAFVPSTQAQNEPTREETLKIAIPGRIEDPTNFNITSWSVSRSDTGLHQVAYEYFFYDN